MAKPWNDETQFMITQCGSKSRRQKMYRYMASVAVYTIWSERNKRSFQSVCSSVESVVHAASSISSYLDVARRTPSLLGCYSHRSLCWLV